MIARLTVAVPFAMFVPDGAEFLAYTYEEEGYEITARPPGKSDVPLLAHVPEAIRIDEKPAFAANAIQFDFHKETFERRRDARLLDPPQPLMQRVVNSFIARLRYVARAAHVQPIEFFSATTWRLRYLNDDGSELPEDPQLRRGLGGRHWMWSFVSVTPTVWDQIYELDPDWEAPVWDDILLDATHALPNVGTALVLAATALEVFISDILDRLAKGGDVPSDMWMWINDRRNRLKDPSPDEQFDTLLKHFVGRSLKEEAELWQAFMNLRTARNAFVHQGHAKLGGKEVTFSDAKQFIAKATDIIRLVREWLPPEHQWPQFESKVNLSMTVPLLDLSHQTEATPRHPAAAAELPTATDERDG